MENEHECSQVGIYNTAQIKHHTRSHETIVSDHETGKIRGITLIFINLVPTNISFFLHWKKSFETTLVPRLGFKNLIGPNQCVCVCFRVCPLTWITYNMHKIILHVINEADYTLYWSLDFMQTVSVMVNEGVCPKIETNLTMCYNSCLMVYYQLNSFSST